MTSSMSKTERQRHGRRWTREQIVEAIHAYVAEFSFAPTVEIWKTPGPWPHHRTVVRVFGSWAAAIESAGLPRPRRGQYAVASRTGPRGRYKQPRKRKSSVPDPRKITKRDDLTLMLACRSLDAPIATGTGEFASLQDVVGEADEGWEDRVIEQMDRRREIDGWADAA